MGFLLTFLFLLSRIFHLLFCAADISYEELVRGVLAKELIGGLRIPFFEHAIDHYVEGALIYGVLAVPFFLLFGKTVFSLRLVAVLFQYGAFITWYFFMKRFFGKRPALYTALLYLFSPPWLTLFSMLANGSHAESLFFTAVGLFLLYKVLYQGQHRSRNGILLGLVCGFGSYFTYGLFVSTLSFFLFWWYEDRHFFRKRAFFLFMIFFLVGFSPWLVYNSLYQFQGTEILQSAFVYPYPEKIFVIPFRFLKLATLKVIGILSFNYRHGPDVYSAHMTPLNFLYYAALLFSYALLYRLERKNRKIYFLFLFPVLYLGVASISRFVMATYVNRYFLPLFPIFFAVIALGLARLGKFSRHFQRVSVGILLLLLAMGLKGGLNLLSPKDFKLSLKYQGYSYRGLGVALLYRYPEDFDRLSYLGKRVEPHLSPPERLAFYHGLGSFQYPLERPEDLQHYLSWIKGFDKLYQPFFLTEMGRIVGLSERPFLDEVNSVAEFLPKADQPYLIEGLIGSFYASQRNPDRIFKESSQWRTKLSPENQRALAYALGKFSWQPALHEAFLHKLKRRHELESLFPPDLLPLYYRGLGALMTDMYTPLFRHWPFPLEDKLKDLDLNYQEAVYWGAGFEAPLLYEDPFEYERMLKGIPTPYQPFFKQGLQDRLEWGGRNYWIEGNRPIARSPK